MTEVEKPWRYCTHRPETDIPNWKTCRDCNAAWRVKDEEADTQRLSPDDSAEGEK